MIPEDWDIDKLASLTQSKRPISYGIVQTGRPIEGGVACIRVVDINDGIINDKDLITTSKEINNSYKRTILNEGDLIIALRGKIGELAVVTKEFEGANLTRGVALIALQEIYSSHFYQQYLSSAESKIRLQNSLNGSALQELPIATVRSFPIAIPPLPEQRAIAATLSDVDALIASLDKLIAKQRHLKTATMQQLLTGKKRLPGFGDEWSLEKLGKLAEIIDPHPSHRAPAEQSFGMPFVGIGDIATEGKINTESARLVDEKIFDEHRNRYCLEDGLIGIGRVASIGKVVRLRSDIGKYVVSPTIAVIKAQAIEIDYLFSFLISRNATEQFDRISNGSTRQSVGMSVLREIMVHVPKTREEQRAIATVLSDMDAAISALETRRAKTQAIKQGMMQELLTGKTRLINNE